MVMDAVRSVYGYYSPSSSPTTPHSAKMTHSRSSSQDSTLSLDSVDEIVGSPVFSPKQAIFNKLWCEYKPFLLSEQGMTVFFHQVKECCEIEYWMLALHEISTLR